MSKVYLSRMTSNYKIGLQQGLRDKFYGKEWKPAQHKLILADEQVRAAMEKQASGYALNRQDFPEATAIFDEKCFSKVGDIFIVGGFYAVKKKVGDILSSFDLGVGGLVSFTIFQSDLKTPVKDKFYYLNIGARKNTVLLNESKNVEFITKRRDTDAEIWKVKPWVSDHEVAVSHEALNGPDLWVEENIDRTLFVSEALATALQKVILKPDFDFTECYVVDKAQ